MQIDNYGRCGHTEKEICDHLHKNPTFDISNIFVINGSKYKNSQEESFIDSPSINVWEDRDISISEKDYHFSNQNKWNLPQEYLEFNIIEYLFDLCKTVEERNRVEQEILLFHEHNLINLLRYMKYIRDVAQENNIVLGVGRGSSCCSYCLYLLKIHRVDSIKYDLNINDFLRV